MLAVAEVARLWNADEKIQILANSATRMLHSVAGEGPPFLRVANCDYVQRKETLSMERFEMFKSLMVMAAADRKFTDEEVEFLALRSSRWGITDQQFEAALQFAKSENAVVSIPEKLEDRERLLRDLIQMMAADGELAPVEQRLFAEAAAKMGISADQLDKVIDELL
jgi:uncharacterized tellurite resistance protein B-like protein